MRILSFNYETALGTAVHATPVFYALRTLRPDWEVHIACSGITEHLFAYHPGIYKKHITAHPAKKSAVAALQIIKIGLQYKFDAVLINLGNCRPRVAINSRLILGGKRIGVSVNQRYADICIDRDDTISIASNNLLLLKPLIPELDIQSFANRMEVFFSAKEKSKALDLRKQLKDGDKPIIGFVTQTSGGQPSEWWDDRFIAVAAALETAIGARCVFLGSKAEAGRIENMVNQLKNAVSLAGKTGIEEIGAYCAGFDLVITLDSGIMHVGRSVGVPMVVIAPAWQPEYEWLPLGQQHIHIIRRWDIGCRNCRKFNCETHECMDEISAMDVINAALQHLQRFPVSDKQCQDRMERWTIGDGHTDLRQKAGTSL